MNSCSCSIHPAGRSAIIPPMRVALVVMRAPVKASCRS
jgi:hypothetical protein